MALHLVFADVSRMDDPRAYVCRKLADFFPEASAEAISHLALSAYTPGTIDAMPLAAPDELPPVSEARRRLLERKIELLNREVNRRSPLIDGETLAEPDRYTLVTCDVQSCVAGTPVMVRRTNMATLYYPFDRVQVTPAGDLVSLPDPGLTVPEATTSEAQLGTAGFSFAELLVTLAKGVAGGMGSKFGDAIGSAILNAIFPSGEGIDTEKLLDEIASIVEMKNTRQTIGEQTAVVNAVVKENTMFYTVRKNGGEAKAELYRILTGYQQRLRTAIESLGYKDGNVDVAKPGLASYVIGASALLAIYQEMATQDPLTDDAKASSILKSIQLTASDSADHVRATAERIVTDAVNRRLGDITEVTSRAICNSVSCQQFWVYSDLKEGTEYHLADNGCNDDARRRCEEHRRQYIASIRKQTQADADARVKSMRDAADAWKALIDTPLPRPVAMLAD